MMTNLRVKRMLRMENLPALTGFASKPIAPSNVPAGQMYLQNPGTGYCCKLYASGIMTTNTASRTYLRYDSAWVKRLFFTFGVGIL